MSKTIHINNDDNYATPPYFYKELNDRFIFDFDPCPYNEGEIINDGLKIDWGKSNFINPPYSRKLKEAFIKKGIAESKKGKLCVFLIPVSTSTNIYHDHVLPNATKIESVRGRIKFGKIDKDGNFYLPRNKYGKTQSGTKDSMIVIFDGRDRTLTMHDAMASLPDISLMQAESIVLEKQSAIDVDCKINHTEIGLLFMEGYYHAKRKLEGNEP